MWGCKKVLGNPLVARSDRANTSTREPVVPVSTEGSHRQSGLEYVPHRKKSFISILFTEKKHMQTVQFISLLHVSTSKPPLSGSIAIHNTLTFWRRNYFFNFSTPCILNVNNPGTKYVRIMKQTAF